MKKIYTFLVGSTQGLLTGRTISTIKFTMTAIMVFTMVGFTNAQNIGVNIGTPDPAAALDVRSASGKKQGVLFPTVALTSTADASTITSPPKGLLVWNDATGGLTPAGYYYNSGTSGTPSWTKVVNGSVMATTLSDTKIWIGDASNIATERTLSGDVTLSNTGVTTIGTNKVDGTKIDLGSSSNGGLMYYNGTDWVNLAPGTTGQILKTIGAGSPVWVDANTTLTKKDIIPNTGSVLTVTNGTSQVVGSTNVTLDVQGTSGGVLYGKGTSTASAFTAAGTTGQVLTSQGTSAPIWSGPGRLVNIVTYTSGSGTYTVPSGVTALVVEAVGPGGAGGSASYSNCSGPDHAAAGGGAGGYCKGLITSPAASYAYSVGSGGVPNTSSCGSTGATGGAGGNTTFGSYTAGAGGGGRNSYDGYIISGGAGGTAAGANINIPGARGGNATSTSSMSSGYGASSIFGGGGAGNGVANGKVAGYAGTAPGAGGSGAIAWSGGWQAGGAGANGMIIIYEYK